MKKRLLILLSAVLTVALVALALSLPGMIRRAKNREEMPVFSAETVTISYVFKGTPEKESSLAEQWDCSAVITDEKTIANLGKLLTDAILDREDSDGGLAPFWKLQFDEADVTLCRSGNWRRLGDLYRGGIYLIYEAKGEKTVWRLKTRLQDISDTLDALTEAPNAQMLCSVQVRRLSDGETFELTGERAEQPRTLLDAVLHKTKRADAEIAYSQFKSTHEVTFTLSGGSVLSMLYSPPAAQFYPCYLAAYWSEGDNKGPMAYYTLTESENTFPALFELLETVP